MQKPVKEETLRQTMREKLEKLKVFHLFLVPVLVLSLGQFLQSGMRSKLSSYWFHVPFLFSGFREGIMVFLAHYMQ